MNFRDFLKDKVIIYNPKFLQPYNYYMFIMCLMSNGKVATMLVLLNLLQKKQNCDNLERS